MENLAYEFYSHPKIVSGACALENIPNELASNDARKPLVITSRDAAAGKLDKKLIKAFFDSACTIGAVFDDVEDYASVGLAVNAAVLFSERGCDSIIALGGGACADVAKAANILVSENTTDLFRYLNGTLVQKKLRPHVFVPDCRCRGTEAANSIAVDHRKMYSDFLYPDVIIIDKRITPADSFQRAARFSAAALDNALAAFTGPCANPMKDAYINTAMQLISGNMEDFIKRPEHPGVSLAMANASVSAAIAAANTEPGLVRILSEELEKYTNVAREVFTAILIPHALALETDKSGPPRQELLLAAGGMEIYSQTPSDKRALKGLEIINRLAGLAAETIGETLDSLRIPGYVLEKACRSAEKRNDGRAAAQDCLKVIELARTGASA
ncbi:MAG: iron-containing alcohol dehydrogenase [Desulfosalsimonas sp.]